MREVCLLGGGRWSRVLAQVLLTTLPPDSKLTWVAHHGHAECQRWLGTIPSTNVKLVHALGDQGSTFDAAIVATAPRTHFADTKTFLEMGTSVLCEKPLTLSFSEALELRELSDTKGLLLGVNVEFRQAQYILDFKTRLGDSTPQSIALDWMDPWSETRHGEVKMGDVYTDIVLDMFTHAVSVLDALQPRMALKPMAAEYNADSSITITGTQGTADVKIRLSRRHPSRARCINVDNGRGILDFAMEPGQSTVRGVQKDHAWNGMRPLATSLSGFFAAITEPQLRASWPLNVIHQLSSIQATERTRLLVQEAREKALRNLQTNDGAELVRLLVDMHAPHVAEAGERPPLATWEDQMRFAERFKT